MRTCSMMRAKFGNTLKGGEDDKKRSKRQKNKAIGKLDIVQRVDAARYSCAVMRKKEIGHDEQSRKQTYPCQFFLCFIYFSLQLGYPLIKHLVTGLNIMSGLIHMTFAALHSH